VIGWLIGTTGLKSLRAVFRTLGVVVMIPGCQRAGPAIVILSSESSSGSTMALDGPIDDAVAEPGSETLPGSSTGLESGSDTTASGSGSDDSATETGSDTEGPPPPPQDVDIGLDARPSNPTCVAWARPTDESDDPFPQRLSLTGCFVPNDPRQPVEGLIPYDVNAPLWSDGTTKLRWMGVPEGETITVQDDGDFDLPIGTVLVKSFFLDERPIETRLLMHHDDDDWAGYSYAWREDGSDADLLETAVLRRFGDQEWTYPSRENCLDCHREIAGRVLGLELAQLNRPFVYARGRANQIATLAAIGLFDEPLPDPAELTAFPTPGASDAPLEDQVRVYWHANCSFCHQPEGVPEATIDLRIDTALADTRICDVNPSRGAFGIPGARLLAPGDPARSLISVRMGSTIVNVRMPQIGTALVDEDAATLVDTWIRQLTECPS